MTDDMDDIKIVAELSANHGGSLEIARKTLRAMAAAGADAVKLQTYTPDSLTLDVREPDFQLHGGLWDGQWLYDLYRGGSLPYEWHAELFGLARELGMECFSTPFDCAAVDMLESLGNPIYKIASFEIMDLELIRYAASKHKPMVMSAGIATDRELREAVEACHSAGNDDITILKCTSAYPARLEDANLAMIPAMRDRYGVKIGLSDHTPGWEVPVVAASLGAVMVEKHFVLDRSVDSPDTSFSMLPQDLAEMVRRLRGGDKTKGPALPEGLREAIMGNVDFDRAGKSPGRQWSRSLYVSAPIRAGEKFTADNVRCVRPGFGLHPRHLPELLGTVARRDYRPGQVPDLPE